MRSREAKFNRILAAYCAGMAAVMLALLLWENGAIPRADYLESAGPAPMAPGVYLVGINSASREALEELTGVGPTLAQAILDYRETYGPFESYEQLLEVKGIGKATLEKILPFISLD